MGPAFRAGHSVEAFFHEEPAFFVVSPPASKAWDRRIGVDIERREPAIPVDIADDILAPQESKSIRCAMDPVAAFFDHWTLKEAYLKACGTGLTRPPSEIVVSPNQAQRYDGFFLQRLDLNPQWSAALAVECHDWEAPPAVLLHRRPSLAAASG